jgi:hypothetical protein
MNFFLFITILLISIKSHSQCLIPFDEFVKSTKFSLSDFDTFALKKGFSFDGKNKFYRCDLDSNSVLKLDYFSNYTDLTYIFYSKSQYLDYKIILESKGKLINQNVNDNGLILQYNYDNNTVLLSSKTVVADDGRSVYTYLIGVAD